MYFNLFYIYLALTLLVTGCYDQEGSCSVETDSPEHDIYVVSHGWHAGIVVQRGAVPESMWPEREDFPSERYLEVGWGDSAYYRDPDPDLLTLVRAGLLPTPSVLHVVGFSTGVEEFFERSEIVRLQLSDDGFDSLISYIHHSYEDRRGGPSSPLGPGLYGAGFFYRAQGKYHVLNNCNHWTAEALRAAGCPITPALSPTVGLLMRQVRQLGKIVRSFSPRESAKEESELDLGRVPVGT